MKQNPNIVIFLQETLQRLFTKSPKFFKIWTGISATLVLITGVPELLSYFDVTIPDLLSAKLTTAVAWASRSALFMSLLTSQSTPVGVTDSGAVIHTTDTQLLPFTAATEQKAADVNSVGSVDVIPKTNVTA